MEDNNSLKNRKKERVSGPFFFGAFKSILGENLVYVSVQALFFPLGVRRAYSCMVSKRDFALSLKKRKLNINGFFAASKTHLGYLNSRSFDCLLKLVSSLSGDSFVFPNFFLVHVKGLCPHD